MKRTRTLRIWGGFWLLLLLLFTFLIWNIFAGSVSLSASEIWRILLGGDVGFTQSQIIMKIRLPRLSSASMATHTVIFAPEEMPSTKGPAMGLWKKVCSR